MNCPKCGKPMEADAGRSRETTNSETGTRYDHIQYVCREDDVWVTTEIPK
ncbi:MAG: hypothetical protein WDN10_00615 [bacterium]